MTGTTSGQAAGRAAELSLPADGAYVAVLRVATAAIAARADFTIDEIEDLRMAVGETCALLLDGQDGSGMLRARFELDADAVRVSTSVTPAPPTEADVPDTSSFAWQVLTALVEDLDASVSDGTYTISFTAARDPR